MRAAGTLTVLLLLTAHASAWGSKKDTPNESSAAAEVCTSPASGADEGLVLQVQQLTEAVGVQVRARAVVDGLPNLGGTGESIYTAAALRWRHMLPTHADPFFVP